ncbi:hypothetical protein BJX61DRAFT_21895 [Aspergillus egyptiacus]|nr:hypothetical protein BJX61DRAFT_21895 [Aspergillus egyptiacus]
MALEHQTSAIPAIKILPLGWFVLHAPLQVVLIAGIIAVFIGIEIRYKSSRPSTSLDSPDYLRILPTQQQFTTN